MKPKKGTPALFLALLLALSAQARAGASLEARSSWGEGSLGLGATVDADLDKDGDWSLSAAYDYSSLTQTSAPSRSNAASLILQRQAGLAWGFKGGIDYSNDDINRILFAGPDLGLIYTRYAGPSRGGDDEGPEELWSLTVAAPIHGYSVDLGANAILARTKAGVPYAVVNNHGTLALTQFYPNLSLEVPLWNGRLTPSLSYGYQYYDKNPAVVAAVISQRLVRGNGSLRVGDLASTLNTDVWNAGLSALLPWDLTLAGSIGEAHLVYPDSWSLNADASLAAKPFSFLRVRLGWSDGIQDGSNTIGYDASMTASY